MRILLAALTLSACSCSLLPIEPDAQSQMDAIKGGYQAARAVELTYGMRPQCPAIEICADPPLIYEARRADYEASAAIVTADSERTVTTLGKARQATQAFIAAALELK